MACPNARRRACSSAASPRAPAANRPPTPATSCRRRCSNRTVDATRRACSDATSRSSASRSGTAASAAADGVAARRSATRSTTDVSISWPTAEITGTVQAATARATRSSLKAQRSSRAPPPRPMITTSAPPQRSMRSMARTSSSAAPSPCTFAGTSTSCTLAQRRAATARMSCSAAPSGLVTTATTFGSRGSARLRDSSSRPSTRSRASVSSSALRHSPSPAAPSRSTRSCRSPPLV